MTSMHTHSKFIIPTFGQFYLRHQYTSKSNGEISPLKHFYSRQNDIHQTFLHKNTKFFNFFSHKLTRRPIYTSKQCFISSPHKQQHAHDIFHICIQAFNNQNHITTVSPHFSSYLRIQNTKQTQEHKVFTS